MNEASEKALASFKAADTGYISGAGIRLLS
jgi:hypothetical protein